MEISSYSESVSDPSLFALLGAAAMLAGSGRVPIFYAAVCGMCMCTCTCPHLLHGSLRHAHVHVHVHGLAAEARALELMFSCVRMCRRSGACPCARAGHG